MELRRARIRFAMLFIALSAVLLTLYSFPYAEHGVREIWFGRYLALYAHLAGALVRVLDPHVQIIRNALIGRTSLVVAKNCDAMDVNILLSAAIAAFPAPWPQRALGVILGVVLLLVTNVVRIASLYYVGVHWPASFEFVHAEAWPLLMAGIAVAAFLVWARWVGGADRRAEPLSHA